MTSGCFPFIGRYVKQSKSHSSKTPVCLMDFGWSVGLRDDGDTRVHPSTFGAGLKAFWRVLACWPSYPLFYDLLDSASFKDCLFILKFFVDTPKLMTVPCLGERYWLLFPNANQTPSLLSPFLFLNVHYTDTHTQSMSFSLSVYSEKILKLRLCVVVWSLPLRLCSGYEK